MNTPNQNPKPQGWAESTSPKLTPDKIEILLRSQGKRILILEQALENIANVTTASPAAHARDALMRARAIK